VSYVARDTRRLPGVVIVARSALGEGTAIGLREAKQEATRRQLVEAAYRLFEERGFTETTVAMIAAEVGVSPRTFHRYFESKEGVLAAPGYRLVEDVGARVGSDASMPDLVELLAARVDEAVDGGELGPALDICRHNPQLREGAALWQRRWADRLADALAAAEGRRQPTYAERIRTTAAVHVSAVAADAWVHGPRTGSVSDLAREALDVLRADLTRSH
jgi:AcrR family transcriptional regulator